jgi:small subunit ribosomal protein S20
MVAARGNVEDPVLQSRAVANIRSQIKRNRQNERRRVRNLGERSRLKTEARRVSEAIAAGDQEGAQTALRTAARQFDKAVSGGAMGKRTAARRKSRLARRVARAGQTAT